MMPNAKIHPVKEVDFGSPKNVLQKPSMRVVLDTISLLRKKHGNWVAFWGKVMGPLDYLVPYGSDSRLPTDDLQRSGKG